MSAEIGYLEKIIIPRIIDNEQRYPQIVMSFLNAEIGRRTDEIEKKDMKVKKSLLTRVDALIGKVPKSTETHRLLNALRDVLHNKPKSTSPVSISINPNSSFPASFTPVPVKPSAAEVDLLKKIGEGLTRRGGRRKRHRRKTIKTR
jgi:hypothetical protein